MSNRNALVQTVLSDHIKLQAAELFKQRR